MKYALAILDETSGELHLDGITDVDTGKEFAAVIAKADGTSFLGPDEPWFLFRGQDVFTPEIIDYYAQLHEAAQNPTDPPADQQAAELRRFAAAIRNWQQANVVKNPD